MSYHFFPNQNHLIALLNTFAVFALGYFARPLGGMVFGHLGDKYGRKYAFSIAILIMATSTLLMGCLPDYQMIGVAAPLLLLVLRLLQGFSVGGEIPGATIFFYEHAALKHRGFAVSIIYTFITLGNTLGVIIGLLLTTMLSSDAMMAWGWRIPFIIGFIVGIVSYIIRTRTIETPEFTAIMAENKLHKIPLLKLFKIHRRNLLITFLMTAVSAATISLFLYLPAYLSNILHMKMRNVYLVNLVSFLAFAVMTAFFGWLSDYCNKKNLMIVGTLLLIASSYFLFSGLVAYGEKFIWLFTLGVAILSGILNGCYAVTMSGLFEPNLRYSGMGLSYSLGFAIFGGLTPLCFTYLIKITNNAAAPAYGLIFCAVLTLISVFLCRVD